MTIPRRMVIPTGGPMNFIGPEWRDLSCENFQDD